MRKWAHMGQTCGPLVYPVFGPGQRRRITPEAGPQFSKPQRHQLVALIGAIAKPVMARAIADFPALSALDETRAKTAAFLVNAPLAVYGAAPG